jgi:hypothetical protein
MDSTIFNERLKNSLKVIERAAENNTKENLDWPVPSSYVPFKLILVSVVAEPKGSSDDEKDDEPFVTETVPALKADTKAQELATTATTTTMVSTAHFDVPLDAVYIDNIFTPPTK